MEAHCRFTYDLLSSGCMRAKNLSAIHTYLKKNAPLALDCDDILRSALVLAVSSLDLFVHDIFRVEVLHRLSRGKNVAIIRIPFDSLHLDATPRHALIDEFIRRDHAHKSFVAPDKLAECLRPLLDNPWEAIAKHFGETPSICKSSLHNIIKLRNRIAHEADINPEYGGANLWPIYLEDVIRSILFIEKLSLAIADALARH